MIEKSMDVLLKYEIRKTKKQKSAFLSAVTDYADRCGYSVKVENGKFGSRNIVIGDPEKANTLVTAHYDTPASIGLPNFITPCNPVAFVICQILMLFPFYFLSFFAAFLVDLVSDNVPFILLVSYIAYFVLLFLLMIGPANRHTANDNTSGVVTLLEIMATMPENQRDKVCFVLFDLEEAGLIGSSSYRKQHKAATDRQTVLNLDCVGDGDHIVLFPGKKFKKEGRMGALRGFVSECGKKSISIREKGFAYYPSDQKHFPYGVGIAAFKKAKFIGLYCDRIHTWRDTVLESTNVNILRAAIISYISNT